MIRYDRHEAQLLPILSHYPEKVKQWGRGTSLSYQERKKHNVIRTLEGKGAILVLELQYEEGR